MNLKEQWWFVLKGNIHCKKRAWHLLDIQSWSDLPWLCFFRVAIVSVRNHKDAEAAVREMNGHTVQGCDLHVEHLHKSPVDGQATFEESCVQLFPAAKKAGSVGEGPISLRSNIVHVSRVSTTQQRLS